MFRGIIINLAIMAGILCFALIFIVIFGNRVELKLKLNTPWWVIILTGGLGLIGWIIVFVSMVSGAMRARAGRY
jgi:hypothetical protein